MVTEEKKTLPPVRQVMSELKLNMDGIDQTCYPKVYFVVMESVSAPSYVAVRADRRTCVKHVAFSGVIKTFKDWLHLTEWAARHHNDVPSGRPSSNFQYRNGGETIFARATLDYESLPLSIPHEKVRAIAKISDKLALALVLRESRIKSWVGVWWEDLLSELQTLSPEVAHEVGQTVISGKTHQVKELLVSFVNQGGSGG